MQKHRTSTLDQAGGSEMENYFSIIEQDSAIATNNDSSKSLVAAHSNNFSANDIYPESLQN